jgi:hypothetical protein
VQTLTAANYSNTLSCRYDAKGSMLSDGTWTYTWEHGRELITIGEHNH